ncbi:MAG: class I SAM-dependent methyltransferase [Bryobacteraceae bacterium]
MKDALQRELEYHEKLYSGFAQAHFARPAVRALRQHMVERILRMTGAGARSRVLSLGCGIGDTELLLAPHVAEVVGVDLSPAAVRQARADAGRLRIANARFEEGTTAEPLAGRHGAAGAAALLHWSEQRSESVTAEGSYDLVMAIFFLHHLPDQELAELPGRVKGLLAPGGVFYSLDPSSRRLSGAIGRLLFPGLMKRYQTSDERELEPEPTAELFRGAGFDARVTMYDFGSSPLAGLLPGWRAGYRAARAVDDWLLRVPALRRLGSNFEVMARL